MKKSSIFLIGLVIIFLISCGWATDGPAQETDLTYENFDSFDPSSDLKRGASKPSSAPIKPSQNRTSASGEQGRPYQGGYEDEAGAPPAPAVERPAPAGFDLSEPGSYEPAPSAPAPHPAHSGFDLSEPGAYETVETGPAVASSPGPAAASTSAPAPDPPAPQAVPAVPLSTAPPVSLSAAVNYSHPDNWLSLPTPDRSVDVFFLYTGSCTRVGQGGAICLTNDPGMRQKAQASLRQQAGVFEPIANIYAPFYRQANGNIFLGLGAEDRAGRLAVSSADAVAAFDYYLKNHNRGRPFILAAHGQGSAAMLGGLLSDYFKANAGARSRMVAAYVLGYSVTSDYLSVNDHLRFAQRRNDAGVIISYSTEAPGLTAPNPVVLPRAVAINPVSWVRSEILAKADSSLGANLSAFGGEEQTEKFADARVSLRRGVVECSTAGSEQYSADDLFPRGAYPGGDYAFYFYDLRANAQERVEAFRQSQGQ